MASENLKWRLGRGTLTLEEACNHLHAEVSINGSNSSGLQNVSSISMAPSRGNNKKRNGKAHKKGDFIPWHKWSKMIKEEKTKHHNSIQTEQRATSQVKSQDSKDPAAKANSAPSANAGTAFGGRAAMAAQNTT